MVNASPLIVLSKIQQLTLLDALADEIVIPAAVLREIAAGGSASTLVPSTRAVTLSSASYSCRVTPPKASVVAVRRDKAS